MAALYQKQDKRNGSVFFVAAVCDRRKLLQKSPALWRDFGVTPG
jgi:hypothetical protein